MPLYEFTGNAQNGLLKDNMMKSENQRKPIGIVKSIIFTVVPATFLTITHYLLIPAYIEHSGEPYFMGYWIGYAATMFLVLALAMFGYVREKHPLTWPAIKARFRIKPMTRGDWMWTLAIIAVGLASYFALGFTGRWVNSVPLLAPREVMPPEWGPQGAEKTIPGEFMGLPLKGKWWVVAVYILGLFFNIVGEEFFFRGYLLPRQELAFGHLAWLVNALSFWSIHIYQPWVLIQILPAVLLLVYIVQRRKNTTISIIQHGFVNSLAVIFLIGGVIS